MPTLHEETGDNGSDYVRGLRTRERDEGRPDFAAGERTLRRDPRAHPDYVGGLHADLSLD